MSQAMLHFDNMEDVRERLENAVTQSSVETSYDGEDCFITVTQKNYETGNKNEWSFCVDFDTQKVIMLEPMEDTEGFSNDNEVFEIIKNFLNGGSSREKRMMYSSKQIKSSYTSWDDFYDKGCKLGLQTYMNALDDIHDKYGKFENVPKDKLSELIMSIPEDSEERHHFLDDMIDYFDFSSILSSKQIKSERMNFVNKDGKRFKGWWNGHTVEVDEVPSNNTDVECMEHYTLEELKRMGYEDEKLYNYNATREFNRSKAAQLMKSSKQIISSNDAKKLFEDEDIKDLIYEWSMYGESKSVRNILKEIDFDNPDTEKFIKFFKAVKKYSTDDELPIIEKALKLLGSSKQIKSSVDELNNKDIAEGMRVTWGGDEKGKVITWNDNDVLIENLGGMKDFIIGHNYKLTGDAKEPKLGWGHGDYGYRNKDEALRAFKKIKSSKESIKSGYVIEVTETDNDNTFAPTYVNGNSWQSENPQVFETREDAEEMADDFRKYLNKQVHDMHDRYQYKIKVIESSRKTIKLSKAIKSSTSHEPTEKDYKFFADMLNVYCKETYKDLNIYKFGYQSDNNYGGYIIVDYEGNLNIHSDEDITRYIKNKLDTMGWYPEAVYSESDFCIAVK